jgi:hypothetical protein
MKNKTYHTDVTILTYHTDVTILTYHTDGTILTLSSHPVFDGVRVASLLISLPVALRVLYSL